MARRGVEAAEEGNEEQRSLLGSGQAGINYEAILEDDVVDGNPPLSQSLKLWWRKLRTSLSPTILALVAALCIFGTANGVIFKVVSTQYTDRFSFFLDQGNNVLYALLALVVVTYKLFFTADITPKMRAFPERKFVIMALLDSFGTFLAFLGSVNTPGQYQTLINQTLIPFTMVLAFFMLGTRYSLGEVASASVVLIGACVAIVPSLLHPDKADGVILWWAVLLYVLSNIPMAASSVYKELGFQNVNLDCYYLTLKVAVYQVILSFALAPLQSVPGFGTADGIPAKQIWVNLWEGCECFVGISSHGIQCDTAGAWLAGYSLTNFIYNVLGLVLLKAGSENGVGAVLCTIAYALKLPLSNLIFTIHAIMGPHTEHFTPWSIGGLVLVLFGFLAYMWFTSLKPQTGAPSGRRATTRKRSLSATSIEADDDEVRSVWGFHDRVVGVATTGAVGVDVVVVESKDD